MSDFTIGNSGAIWTHGIGIAGFLSHLDEGMRHHRFRRGSDPHLHRNQISEQQPAFSVGKTSPKRGVNQRHLDRIWRWNYESTPDGACSEADLEGKQGGWFEFRNQPSSRTGNSGYPGFLIQFSEAN